MSVESTAVGWALKELTNALRAVRRRGSKRRHKELLSAVVAELLKEDPDLLAAEANLLALKATSVPPSAEVLRIEDLLDGAKRYKKKRKKVKKKAAKRKARKKATKEEGEEEGRQEENQGGNEEEDGETKVNQEAVAAPSPADRVSETAAEPTGWSGPKLLGRCAPSAVPAAHPEAVRRI